MADGSPENRLNDVAQSLDLEVEIYRRGPFFGGRVRTLRRVPAGQVHHWTYAESGHLARVISQLADLAEARWGSEKGGDPRTQGQRAPIHVCLRQMHPP